MAAVVLIEHDDPHLRGLIGFRDRLRADKQERDQYAELEQTLAQEHRTDRQAYTARYRAELWGIERSV